MIITLHTETTIDSCHKLIDYNGKCSNMHGHTWKIELWFKGDEKYKNKIGILVDFGIVKELKEKLDHKYLNDIININPTAENLSKWIYTELRYEIKDSIKIKVRVYETAVDKLTYCELGDFD